MGSHRETCQSITIELLPYCNKYTICVWLGDRLYTQLKHMCAGQYSD